MLLTLGRRRHLSSGQRDTGGRVRNLALSFSANSPRAAPVPRLIAVSRASGHVVSCARARARNFVASRTISIFSVSLWSVIVCVRIHAVIKNVTSLRHDTWRAGRTMDPSFDAAKITSNLLCASRLCVSDAAEEAASAQMPRHRGRAIDRPTCRRDAARSSASVQRVCSRARGGFCCLERPARRAQKNTAIISAPAPGPLA